MFQYGPRASRRITRISAGPLGQGNSVGPGQFAPFAPPCRRPCEHLPSSLDYMVRESYNWFQRSALRRNSFMELHRTISDGKAPLQLVALSSTRWLARSHAIKRILENWDSLKLHFEISSSVCDKYLARELHRMYSDPVQHLYLIFVLPIMEDFEKMNVLFQSQNADHYILLKQLEEFTLAMLGRILYPQHVKLEVDLGSPFIYLPIEKVDFGYTFSNKLATVSRTIALETVKDIQLRCHNFLKSSCEELIKRIPLNLNILKKISVFSPKVCLNPASRPPFSDLPLQLADQSQLSAIENQWRKISNTDLSDVLSEKSCIDHGGLFWCRIFDIKDAVGNHVFRELALFALKLYSLPISNATVERVFSRVSLTKTKLRNRMSLELLDSIIRIQMHLKERELCCVNFKPTKKMLEYTSDIYKTAGTENDTNELEELLDASI